MVRPGLRRPWQNKQTSRLLGPNAPLDGCSDKMIGTNCEKDSEILGTTIRAIVQMLTNAKLIDTRGYFSTPFINQCISVAACAVLMDMRTSSNDVDQTEH